MVQNHAENVERGSPTASRCAGIVGMRKRSRMIGIEKTVLSERSLSVWPRPSKFYVRYIDWRPYKFHVREISPLGISTGGRL